jgi:hypothetical protein
MGVVDLTSQVTGWGLESPKGVIDPNVREVMNAVTTSTPGSSIREIWGGI